MSDTPQCPHCDRLCRRDDRGRLYRTCGSDACFRRSCQVDINQRPWHVRHDIDFGNGFAAQNLRFRPARERIVTRPETAR